MILSILFWVVICIDLAVLGLFFVLGLAAAPSSHTSVFSVAAFMLGIPGLLIALSIFLFLIGKSKILRGLAFLLAASPILVVLVQQGVQRMEIGAVTDAGGNVTFFRAGPLREISDAISRNDAVAVARLAPTADVNSRGFNGMTLLVAAFRQLRKTPTQLDVVRALLKAGADPNAGSDELPLQMALQLYRETGPEPVRLLLEAGAKPNAKGRFGTPVYFHGIGHATDAALLQLLFDHGADIKATDKQGRGAVHQAALSSNWKAVLFLIEKGGEWKQIRTASGSALKDLIESDRRMRGESEGMAELLERITRP